MNHKVKAGKRYIITGLGKIRCERCNQEIKPNEDGVVIVPCPCRERKLNRGYTIDSVSVCEILPDEHEAE